jgi:hypothetical protein
MTCSYSLCLWVTRYAVVALAFAVLNSWSSAQSFTLIFDSGDEIDTVTFDPGKISDTKLRDLMLLSPYIVDYFNQLPARDIWAGGSTNGGVPDKSFFPLSLDFCEPRDGDYVHCETTQVDGPNFVHNAKVNLNKGRRGLDWLETLEVPKDLEPVTRFLVDALRISLQTGENKLKYYSTWDQDFLRKAHEGIQPAEQCSTEFWKLDGAASQKEKYAVVEHDWSSCVNQAIHEKLGHYPVESWKAFLHDYGIVENLKEIGPPD